MALVLQQRLAPNSTALVGGYCSRPSKTVHARRESGRVGEIESPAMNTWRIKKLQIIVRGGEQHQIRSNAAAALLQQTLLHSCEAHLSSAQVFEDEAQGICCYRSPTGEVTCEGHDEGPHFQPAECCPERSNEANPSNCESSPTQGVFAYKYVKGEQGKCWCEGKDES